MPKLSGINHQRADCHPDYHHFDSCWYFQIKIENARGQQTVNLASNISLDLNRLISPEDFEDTISQWSSFDSIITEPENLLNVFNHRKLIYRQTPARVFDDLLQNRFRVKPGMTVTKYLVSRPLPLFSQ